MQDNKTSSSVESTAKLMAAALNANEVVVQPEAVVQASPARRFSVPETLFTPMFDAAPLKNVIDVLVGKVAQLEGTTSELQVDNTKLRAEVATCTHKFNVSQEQLSAMFQTITTFNEELVALRESSLPRKEAKKQFDGLSAETAAIRESILDLDNKKIDTHSSLLETRIREVADDSSNRFLLRREREQREWLTLQINSMDNKVTTSVENTKASVSQQMEELEGRVEKKQADVQAEISGLGGEVKNYIHTQEGIDRSFITKFDALERLLSEVSAHSQTELDRVDSNLKKSLKCFGIDWTLFNEVIAGSHPAIVVEDDADTVQVGYHRDVLAMQLTHEFSVGWKHVRHANYKLLSHIPRFSRSAQQSSGAPTEADQPPDLDTGRRRLDMARDDKLRAVKKQREVIQQQQQQQQSAVAASGGKSTGSAVKGVLSTASKFLLGTQVLLDLRGLVTDDFMKNLGSTKTEICDDLAVQVQRIQRELRQKVGSQRAVELIEEFAAKTVSTEVLKVTKSVKDISQAVIPRDELEARLRGKADTSSLAAKVDAEELSQAEAGLRSEYSNMAETLVARVNASVDGKIKEVQETKLSKTDDVFIEMLDTVDQIANGTHPALSVFSKSSAGGGSTIAAQSAGTEAKRCLTCGAGSAVTNPVPMAADPDVLVGSASARAPQAAQAMRTKPAQLEAMREEELQSAQDTLHLAQMKQTQRGQQLASRSNKPTGGAKDSSKSHFSLQGWADGVDTRHNRGQHQVRRTQLEEQEHPSPPGLGTVVGPPTTEEGKPPQVLKSSVTGESIVTEGLFIQGGGTAVSDAAAAGSTPKQNQARSAVKPPHPPSRK